MSWLTFAKTDEIVLVSGKIVPIGDVKEIQMPIGGIAKEIFVNEGDIVEKGDLLIQLDKESSLAEFTTLTESLKLKESLIDKGLSIIIKRHFNTRDCIQFSLIENYANEKTNINNATKAFMDIINIQEEWYNRKNKNLSNTT